jgi:peptidoglycan-associated lipoprotein
MRSAMRSSLLTFGSLALAIALTGCAGRSWQFWKTSSPTESPKDQTVATAPPATARPETSNVPTATPAPSAETAADLPQFSDVRFGPGLVTIGKADLTTLDAVARWLKDNPRTLVRIEGHTDDLGSQVENLAVGQKRAASVMRYMVSTPSGSRSSRTARIARSVRRRPTRAAPRTVARTSSSSVPEGRVTPAAVRSRRRRGARLGGCFRAGATCGASRPPWLRGLAAAAAGPSARAGRP